MRQACEASINLAMYLIRRFKLGAPQESRHAFDLLVDAGKLDLALADALKRLVSRLCRVPPTGARGPQ